jgi:hypothetical protein
MQPPILRSADAYHNATTVEPSTATVNEIIATSVT